MLVGGLIGVLLLWQGGGVLGNILFGPIYRRYANIAELDEKLKTQGAAKDRLDLTEHKMRLWERRSLPPNSTVASNKYYFWVRDLLLQHKFDEAKLVVTPAPLNSGFGAGNGIYTRIPISVTAECKMEQLCQFLYDFYRADLMHKVTRMAIESQDFKANPTLKVTLQVEGLALTSAKARGELFADKQDKSVSDFMAKKTFADYKPLVDKNRFVRGYNGPPPPPTPPGPPPTPFDAAPYTRLVTVWKDEGSPAEAWLYDSSSNKQLILTPGKEFEISGVKGQVLDIDVRASYMTIRAKDKDWRLDLGDNLKQMVELKPGEASPAKPSSPNQNPPPNPAPAKAGPSA